MLCSYNQPVSYICEPLRNGGFTYIPRNLVYELGVRYKFAAKNFIIFAFRNKKLIAPSTHFVLESTALYSYLSPQKNETSSGFVRKLIQLYIRKQPRKVFN